MSAAALLAVAAVLGAAYAVDSADPRAASHGDPRRGAALISQFGCGTCHVVPGVGSATGNVGPPLSRMGDRAYIAGVLANTPENMERWLQKPQQIVPGNAMPDLGLSERDARDLTAYLDSLR
ncbi:MAG TPA: c-type cytochrome [Stellaceae bacterium]|nr:c-type cytochrome [Stellaceae bacterium]